jgi:putative transposase
MRYQFIAEYRHEYSITLMCRVLEVSVSGYYAWSKRAPRKPRREDAHLAEQVKTVFQANRRVYGSPRVHAELQAQGIACARKRVARLMREQELFAQRPAHSYDYHEKRTRCPSGSQSASARRESPMSRTPSG